MNFTIILGLAAAIAIIVFALRHLRAADAPRSSRRRSGTTSASTGSPDFVAATLFVGSTACADGSAPRGESEGSRGVESGHDGYGARDIDGYRDENGDGIRDGDAVGDHEGDGDRDDDGGGDDGGGDDGGGGGD